MTVGYPPKAVRDLRSCVSTPVGERTIDESIGSGRRRVSPVGTWRFERKVLLSVDSHDIERLVPVA